MDTDALTVAELLGIHLEHEPAVYVAGSEPAPAPVPRPARQRAPCLDRTKVAPFYEATRAGVPDADIARAAGVTLSQVRAWRLRLGLRRRPGTTTMARLHGAALDTPSFALMLRQLHRRDDADRPARERVPYEELVSYLAARGLSLTSCDFRERSSALGRRSA